jgi:hypothetical protein
VGSDRTGSPHARVRITRHLADGILAVLILAGCSPTSGTVIGPVISVDGDLTEVQSFTVLVEGDEMVFVPIVDGEYAFPLPHLREHLRDGAPIRVGWERRGESLVATTLEDA